MQGMLTLIVGPFIGAFAAFMVNRLLDASRGHKDQLVAANLALLTLKNQYNEFLLFRKGFREDVVRSGLAGNEPLWVLVRPSFITFAEYELDTKSLGFLFERTGNRSVLDKIELAQILYRDMVAISKLRTETAASVQKSVRLFVKDNPDASWDSMEHAVGAEIIALMSMIAVGLALRCERDETKYIDAFNELRRALNYHLSLYWADKVKSIFCCSRRSYESKLLNLNTPKKSFLLTELPAMPRNLAAEIEKVPLATD